MKNNTQTLLTWEYNQEHSVIDLDKSLSMTYEEKMKNPKLKNDITFRWRSLGLVKGIKPNSKTEKNVIVKIKIGQMFLKQ